ncbi:MAG: DegQ family serine endoprotease [Kiritimatiellae bacterium]|nr:DegQ family serine endoprotease [Kiritimatiellia bacterium]
MNTRYRRDQRIYTCIAALILIFGTTMCANAKRANPVNILEMTGAAFAEIAEQATPAVVFISAEKTTVVGIPAQPFGYNDPFGFFGDEFLRRFFHGQAPNRPHNQPRKFRQMGQGSGFLISKDGYILTNHHVVGDADKITVKLHDGREFEAKRIGTDAKSEVAVVKIDSKELPCLKLGDSAAIRVGEWVVAIGNPFGLTATLTAGIVSAKGRSGMGITDYEDFIQTDAAINPGNSGGPLLNINGEVVGINTAIYSRSGGNMGIGFAIPVNMAKSIKEQLVKSGKVTRGYLGVIIQEMTGDLAESFDLEEPTGILVSDVSADSPAEKAELKQGDIILQLNGKPVKDIGEFRNEISSNPPGTKLKLSVFRDGKEIKVEAQTEELPDDIAVAESVPELSQKLGLSVQNMTAENAQKYGYEGDAGVIVTNVEQGSLAGQAGIQPGNLIISANRKPVTTVKAFLQAVSEAEKNGTLLLRVQDKKYSRYVVLRLK